MNSPRVVTPSGWQSGPLLTYVWLIPSFGNVLSPITLWRALPYSYFSIKSPYVVATPAVALELEDSVAFAHRDCVIRDMELLGLYAAPSDVANVT